MTRQGSSGHGAAHSRPDAIRERLQNRPLVLIGMPGSGKSSLGRALAEALAVSFRDSDAEIEVAAGTTIPDYFARFGEPAFREAEGRMIRNMLTEGPSVIATGGGAILSAETRSALAEKAITVWLQTEIPAILSRLELATNRPLLNVPDRDQKLRELLTVREPLYSAAANIIIKSDGASLGALTTATLDALHAHLI